MSTTSRTQELRQALGFARSARARLREGRIADAARYHGYAVRALAFILGSQSARREEIHALSCTATLHRIIAELGASIEAAIRGPSIPPIDVTDLIDEIAAGIDVLRTRDGVDMDESAPLERARNIATVLLGKYEFRAVTRNPSTPPNGTTNVPRGTN